MTKIIPTFFSLTTILFTTHDVSAMEGQKERDFCSPAKKERILRGDTTVLMYEYDRHLTETGDFFAIGFHERNHNISTLNGTNHGILENLNKIIESSYHDALVDRIRTYVQEPYEKYVHDLAQNLGEQKKRNGCYRDFYQKVVNNLAQINFLVDHIDQYDLSTRIRFPTATVYQVDRGIGYCHTFVLPKQRIAVVAPPPSANNDNGRSGKSE